MIFFGFGDEVDKGSDKSICVSMLVMNILDFDKYVM
jgi:hypothetical protein